MASTKNPAVLWSVDQNLETGDQSRARTNIGLGSAAVKDAPASGVNATSTQVVMGDDTRLTDSRNPLSHMHGYIQNDGTFSTASGSSATIATSDSLLIVDDTDKKIKKALTFDTTGTNQYLSVAGTWSTPPAIYYNTAQQLTTAQQSQARTNIGAASTSGNLTVEEWLTETGGIRTGKAGKVEINMQDEFLEFNQTEDAGSSPVSLRSQRVPDPPSTENHLLLSTNVQKGSSTATYAVARWSNSGIGNGSTPIYINSSGVLSAFNTTGFRELGGNILRSTEPIADIEDTEVIFAAAPNSQWEGTYSFDALRNYVNGWQHIVGSTTPACNRFKLCEIDLNSVSTPVRGQAILTLAFYGYTCKSITMLLSVDSDESGGSFNVALSLIGRNRWPIHPSETEGTGTGTNIDVYTPAVVVTTVDGVSTLSLIMARYDMRTLFYAMVPQMQLSLLPLFKPESFTWSLGRISDQRQNDPSKPAYDWVWPVIATPGYVARSKDSRAELNGEIIPVYGTPISP